MKLNSIEARSILNLSGSFSEVELKKAYRKAAARSHPDTGGSSEQFNLVNTAYEYLKEVSSDVYNMQITHKSLFNIGRKVD